MDGVALRTAYTEVGSVRGLARHLGLGYAATRARLQEAGIEIKKTGFRSPKTVTHSGPDSHNWKGGTFTHSDGYVYEYAPEHPDAVAAKGYVLQHRLVMERKIGRRLKPHEIVHHRNEVKSDNRPENLELTNRSLHMQGHKDGTARDARGRFLE